MTYRELKVVLETNHIIVVVKPQGILSQKDNTGDKSIQEIVKEYIKEKYHKPGNVYLGLVHRLDRMTSGLMVFAKTSKAASRLSEQVRQHYFEKKYLAVVEGKLNGKGTLHNQLVFDELRLKAMVVDNQGKDAVLDYQVVNHIGDNTLVEVELKTGRHHQIRVQFANILHPLYGDSLYGSKVQSPIMLHAYYLSFFDPITKEKIVLKDYPLWYERNK